MDRIKTEELLCTKYGVIHRFLKALGIKKDEREDVGHEVMIRAFKNLHQLKDVDKMDTWLWAISENVAYDYRKKRKKERQESVPCETETLEIIHAKTEMQNYNSMITKIDRLTDKDAISHALKALDQKVAAIFRFHYYMGYPLKEVAQASGINYNTVKSLHLRGLKKLEGALLKEEDNGYNG